MNCRGNNSTLQKHYILLKLKRDKSFVAVFFSLKAIEIHLLLCRFC